ncbi:TPA: DUF91 domain-containing protein [Clostridium botulinum]|nr:DUF91 domain-containing protein [Clostridium botulinum]
MINYEDVIFECIINEFAYMYGILDRKVLYRYIYLRFLCSQVKKDKLPKIDNLEKNITLINFVIKELNLENEIWYKGAKVYKHRENYNSLLNIMEAWEFETNLHPIIDSEGNNYTLVDYIDKSFNFIFFNAKNKSKKYKKDKFYRYYIKYFLLGTLNSMFNVNNINPPRMLKGFKYSEFHNNIKLLMEEECYRYIHLSRFESNNVGIISEQQLEDFLIKNLNLIEEELTYINRQVTITNGRLDILAKDKKGCYVILELKVCEDKDILWQSVYYPTQFKLENNVKEVRFITILPKSKPHIISPLKSLGYVEIIEYDPYIENSKLVGIKIKRL